MTINYRHLTVPKAIGIEVDDIIARLTEEYRQPISSKRNLGIPF